MALLKADEFPGPRCHVCKQLRLVGAVADGFFGESGLPTDAIGDLWRAPFVKANDGYIFQSADKEKGSQPFPHLVVTRVDTSDFGASSDVDSDRRGEQANAAGDGRADFNFLVARPKLGDQAASTDSRASGARVSNDTSGRSDDADWLQELQ